MTTPPDKFERIRLNIKNYEREAMEISSPLTLSKGTSSSGLSRDQLVHLVGLLWKLSSAYKDYARLLEQALTDIRDNMGEGREEVQALEDAAANLDRLIDGLQKIEDLTTEFRE